MPTTFWRLLSAAAIAGSLPTMASAQTFLNDFVGQTVASGFQRATAMEFAPDGRLFVCEKGGALRVVKNGTLLSDPFMTLTVDTVGERGLLGIAFDPNFAINQHLYVYYTVISGSQRFNRISRFTASGDTVVPGSEVVLMNLNPLGPTNHNGGAIHFGPDGKLYIAVGENANPANSQSLNNRLGKILRLNPDGSIPTDNPFFNTATGDNRAIWARGLRNPYTFAFHPTTGELYLNDVGQVTWEEINVGVAGANYGWGSGGGANEGPFDPTAFPAFTAPLFAYGHGTGTSLGFAISGGAFYHPVTPGYPGSYRDDYFYGDYVNGWIRALNGGTSSSYLFASGLGNLTDLKVGADGYLYYLEYRNTPTGAVRRIAYSGALLAPEPGSLALMALGVGLLGFRLRKRPRRPLEK